MLFERLPNHLMEATVLPGSGGGLTDSSSHPALIQPGIADRDERFRSVYRHVAGSTPTADPIAVLRAGTSFIVDLAVKAKDASPFSVSEGFGPVSLHLGDGTS
jgi:hypothetical protein